MHTNNTNNTNLYIGIDKHMKIILKTENDLKKIRISGSILSSLLKRLKNEAKEGVELLRLDHIVERFLKEAGAKSAFLNYKPEGAKIPYPAQICVSVNHQVVHGVPSHYKLKNGDILAIDAGVNYEGYITDAAISFGIGQISDIAERLIEVTERALREAVKFTMPGNTLGDIGWTIESIAKKAGFNVAEGLTGHGVGFKLHEDPPIYNYGEKGKGLKLKAGMVLAIEPIINAGGGKVLQAKDDSFVTADGSLSAHFEQTIAITESGQEILT